MVTEQNPTEEATVAPAVTEAPAPAPAPKRTRAARPNAKAKAVAKAKAQGKAARTPIPAGFTRSRGALIPVANGQCALAVGTAQCSNPGRWEATIQGRKVRTCTTHKRANAAKATLFAAPARRSQKAVAAAAS